MWLMKQYDKLIGFTDSKKALTTQSVTGEKMPCHLLCRCLGINSHKISCHEIHSHEINLPQDQLSQDQFAIKSTASPTDLALLVALRNPPLLCTFFEVRGMLACWFCMSSTRSQSSKTFGYVDKKRAHFMRVNLVATWSC